jgi:hypothetical protein
MILWLASSCPPPPVRAIPWYWRPGVCCFRRSQSRNTHKNLIIFYPLLICVEVAFICLGKDCLGWDGAARLGLLLSNPEWSPEIRYSVTALPH